jgi:hypothetical protein
MRQILWIITLLKSVFVRFCIALLVFALELKATGKLKAVAFSSQEFFSIYCCKQHLSKVFLFQINSYCFCIKLKGSKCAQLL